MPSIQRLRRLSIWVYVLLLVTSIILFYMMTEPRTEHFTAAHEQLNSGGSGTVDVPKDLRSTMTPYVKNANSNKEPIEAAGYGPFDYGIDVSDVKVSSETSNNINYFNGQKKNADAGNFNHNIFSYLGS